MADYQMIGQGVANVASFALSFYFSKRHGSFRVREYPGVMSKVVDTTKHSALWTGGINLLDFAVDTLVLGAADYSSLNASPGFFIGYYIGYWTSNKTPPRKPRNRTKVVQKLVRGMGDLTRSNPNPLRAYHFESQEQNF